MIDSLKRIEDKNLFKGKVSVQLERILLFIPGYNCEKQITRVLQQLDDQVMKYITEIIMVNNRSTDLTEQAVLDYVCENPLPLTLIRNDQNYGLGGSHKVAFDYAQNNGFQYVIVLHGDDQGDIHDILALLESGVYRDYDCCLGARFMKGSNLKGYSLIRTFGNKIYNIIFSISTGRKVYDLGSGLNIYKTSMLKSRFYTKFSDNLMFNCYMLLANSLYKFDVKYFPISWREDDQVSNVRLFSQGIKTLKIALGYFFSTNKSRFLDRDFRQHEIPEYTATKISRE